MGAKPQKNQISPDEEMVIQLIKTRSQGWIITELPTTRDPRALRTFEELSV